MAILTRIKPGKDFDVIAEVVRANPQDLDTEHLEGAVGFIAWLSATKDGSPIHASLQVNLAEPSNAPGFQFGTILGADTLTYLTPYLGRKVYLLVGTSAGDAQYVELLVVSAIEAT